MDESDSGLTGSDEPGTVSTHISLLVLTGERVLKFRKPIITDFCDFTTIASRLRDCEREVELNRRLTNDVYLGVGRVLLDHDDHDDGEPCVVMRRLPADRLLSELVATGQNIEHEVRAIARQLAVFHATAMRRAAPDPSDGGSAARARWADAVEQLRGRDRDRSSEAAFVEIARLSTRWTSGREALFNTRLEDGFVRDGHGDLRAENIFCLDDGPRILDCIEFDDELRCIDVATDLAFLVMDLRRLGRAGDAETLIVEYETAGDSEVPRRLLDHDVAYWALVRAKVAYLRFDQGDPTAHNEATDLEALALEQLRSSNVRLVLVGGLPGTGKSTVARTLAARTDWVVIASDHVRKERAAMPATARTGDGYGTGLYEPDQVAATYTEMLQRARRYLEHGQSVILDASWSRSSDRADAATLALDTDTDLHQLQCTLDADIARRRLIARAKEDVDASDADPNVARQMATTYEPWAAARQVDTTGPIEETITRVLRMLSMA